MNLSVIVPVTTMTFVAAAHEAYIRAARADTSIRTVGLERGPASIECDYEVALAVPEILLRIDEAVREGVDGIVIDCMMDPGLEAARERVAIPVVGAAESSFHLAAMLAERFAVVTILERDVPLLQRLFDKYGVTQKVAGIRVIDIPVLDLAREEAQVANRAAAVAREAIRRDGAQAIVFGCTGMRGVADAVRRALAGCGCAVPVIEPSLAALKLAESLVDMRLSHSKLTYPTPPLKVVLYP